jgi:hypothetical protein
MARRLYPTEKKNMSILSLTVIRLRRVTLRSAVVAIFGGLLISACSTVGFSKTAPPVSSTCHSAQQCAVPVEVDCGPSPCVIRISSQFTNVDANGFDVVWQIVPKAGQSYTFRNPGGVSFKEAEGQRLFRCQPEMNGARFRCHSNVKNGKPYEYGIELVGSPPVSFLDPWIVNR